MFLIIFVLFFLLYWWLKRNYNYWTDNGIPQVEGTLPFGALPKERTFVYSFQEVYEKFKGKTKFVGIYNILKPILMVIDEDLIKQIFVKDFNYFQSRGMYFNEQDDPLSANLFFVDNPKWRMLRTKMTPTFTSGKMKYMCPAVVEVGKRLHDVLAEKISNGECAVEMREVLARFTTDVIGNIAFGIDCDSLRNPDSQFRMEGTKIFTKPRSIFIRLLQLGFPDLARKFHSNIVPDSVTAFFMNVIEKNLEYRIKNNINRNDFFDLLLAMKNEQKSNSMDDVLMDGLSVHEIAAQCFIFFIAGFETSSSASSFTIYELSKNQQLQDKLRNHIQEVLKQHNGQLSYEALKDMTYLEQCINEGMRRYPPLPLLTRKTTQPYKLPGTDMIVPKDTIFGFPMYAIHNDPNNFEDPNRYDPDRFLPENIASNRPFSFLPFGEGPRNCIGERFGMMQTKIGLAYLIGNFKFTLNPMTKPLRYNKKSIILAPVDGFYFDIIKV